MKNILLASVLLITMQAQAQNKHPFSVKGYMNISPTHFVAPINENFPNYHQETTWSNFAFPSIAFNVQNKSGNYHEFEINKFSIAQEDKKYEFFDSLGRTYLVDGYKQTTTNIALRYEHILSLFKKKKFIVKPSVGLGVMPYYSRVSMVPYTTAGYPALQTYIGINAFVVPRININFSPRVYMDLNMPVCIADFGVRNAHFINPATPLPNQQYNVVNAAFFPAYLSFRLGMGFRI